MGMGQGRREGKLKVGSLSWPHSPFLGPLGCLPDRPRGVPEPGNRPKGRRREEFLFWLLLSPVPHRSNLASQGIINTPL